MNSTWLADESNLRSFQDRQLEKKRRRSLNCRKLRITGRLYQLLTKKRVHEAPSGTEAQTWLQSMSRPYSTEVGRLRGVLGEQMIAKFATQEGPRARMSRQIVSLLGKQQHRVPSWTL